MISWRRHSDLPNGARRSSSEQAAVRRARSSSKDATQATADAASDGGLSGELGQLFRDEDVSQLASDFPLPGAAPEGGGAKTNQPDAHGGALPGRQRGMGVLSEEELLEQRGEALSQLYKLYKVWPGHTWFALDLLLAC